MILDRINSAKDVKKLDIEELNTLADEIRKVLIDKISVTGGHMGSNLGIVEATIALHYVFDSPKDKIVFDVSHQSYTHKILTGRKEGFTKKEKFNVLSGYTTPFESEHDIYKVGHTSTSISLSSGLAKARDELGEKYNVIAVIGDGALSGGESFEGLNNVGKFKSNFIVLFNDNEMSIAVPQGALNDHFRELRESKGQCANNYFKLLGFDYMYVEDGNDIQTLIDAFNKVKDIDHPIVVHIHTLKGKGLKWAIDNKELGHWAKGLVTSTEKTYFEWTQDILEDAINKDEKVFVVNAATPMSCGLSQEFRERVGKHFIDVGICEEHAVAFVSSMAKGGLKPVLVIKSNFMQRTYDQLNQDLAMNNTSAVIIVMDAKVQGGDCTHIGMYDIGMTANIPNLVCLAPSNLNEYKAMVTYAINQNKHPVIIRAPQHEVYEDDGDNEFSEEDIGRYVIKKKGHTFALIGLGSFYKLAEKVYEELREWGYKPTLINPRTYSSLDEDTLEDLKRKHDYVITLEDGILDGGFGERIARYYGPSDMKVYCFGAEKAFNDLMPTKDVLEKNNLTVEKIVSIIKQI